MTDAPPWLDSLVFRGVRSLPLTFRPEQSAPRSRAPQVLRCGVDQRKPGPCWIFTSRRLRHPSRYARGEAGFP
jgi:hypothetical protein